ncbi:MAG TPA: DUF1566 domain-containing protein [Nitrospiraceae bacterium]|nr:DUF1566 domain-containing protein [Nitrospiraceae bacterium]
MMKRQRLLTVSLGLSALGGLLTIGCVSGGESVGAMRSAEVIDLSGVPPNWDKALPSTQRFVSLAAFNNDAVRDNNTGLVWEKSPQTAAVTWNGARFACINKNVGGQKGWRLPSISDLASLIDPSVSPPGPTLPSGHPFHNIQSAGYWSATTNAEDASDAWFVYFGLGFVDHDSKARTGHAWCVRSSMNADAY